MPNLHMDVRRASVATIISVLLFATALLLEQHTTLGQQKPLDMYALVAAMPDPYDIEALARIMAGPDQPRMPFETGGIYKKILFGVVLPAILLYTLATLAQRVWAIAHAGWTRVLIVASAAVFLAMAILGHTDTARPVYLLFSVVYRGLLGVAVVLILFEIGHWIARGFQNQGRL
jgi:hypothetical protein